MPQFICNMNRLDWDGNPGTTVRRGEVLEMDDEERIKTLLDAKYILPIPEQTPAPEQELEKEDLEIEKEPEPEQEKKTYTTKRPRGK